LAALLVLTLIMAQVVSLVLFTGERISAFREAYRENLVTRLVSLVQLLEEAPPELHPRLVDTASSPGLRIAVAADSILASGEADPPQLQAWLAEDLGKSPDDLRVSVAHRGWRRAQRQPNGRGPRPWANLSVRLDTGQWLNATADMPPAPRLGPAFLVSFLISAIAVAAVGAYGVRRASRPLLELAVAANRLGRGESFVPLPETGPRETRETNAAFNRMRERLDRFVRDRTAMLAAVAHDLRTHRSPA
jgi:signal transduction histidine kinase